MPSGVYYFRRVIPPALRPFMPDPWRGKSAGKLSLRTSEYGEAKRRADGAIRARYNADFIAAERAARGGHAAQTFPAGSATRTLLGKAEVVLIRYQDAMPRYRVECWRSFATYVHGFLKEAAFGLGPDRLHATR